MPYERRQDDRFLWALLLRDRSLIAAELDREKRKTVRVRWEQKFLESSSFYHFQFSYLIGRDASEQVFYVFDAILGISIPGYSSEFIASRCCEFLEFQASRQKTASHLVSDLSYNHEAWLCEFFTIWRSLWEETGFVDAREMVGAVDGYKLTGDR